MPSPKENPKPRFKFTARGHLVPLGQNGQSSSAVNNWKERGQNEIVQQERNSMEAFAAAYERGRSRERIMLNEQSQVLGAIGTDTKLKEIMEQVWEGGSFKALTPKDDTATLVVGFGIESQTTDVRAVLQREYEEAWYTHTTTEYENYRGGDRNTYSTREVKKRILGKRETGTRLVGHTQDTFQEDLIIKCDRVFNKVLGSNGFFYTPTDNVSLDMMANFPHLEKNHQPDGNFKRSKIFSSQDVEEMELFLDDSLIKYVALRIALKIPTHSSMWSKSASRMLGIQGNMGRMLSSSQLNEIGIPSTVRT